MTKAEQAELVELMRQQQIRESAECIAKAEAEGRTLSANHPPKMSDNDAVDLLMSQAKGVSTAPRLAYEEWMRAKMRVIRLRARAEQIGGMRLSQDKVSGGSPLMMDDQVGAVLEAEEKERHQWLLYLAAKGSFEYCLVRAQKEAGFTNQQCQAWKLYYAGETRSQYQVADLMHTTRRRIEHLLTSTRAQVMWCKAIEYVIENETNYEQEDELMEVG